MADSEPTPALVRAPIESDARAPDLFSMAGARLSAMERFNIAMVRRTFTSPTLDAIVRWCQRVLGAGWIDVCTKNIRHAYGLERLENLPAIGSFVLVANHRSFFDLFVLSMLLLRAGLKQRILYPVRSTFFYDNPLGVFVNAVMSFCSMYPPIFRDRKKAALNYTALNEVVWFLTRRGLAAAMHPEGTRKKDDDPYSFLPAQSGVGRTIYQARVLVIPAFINGLGNNLVTQVGGNFTRKGRPVIAVFGAPIDFGDLLEGPASGRTYRAIAEHTLKAIGALAEEEREIRAKLEGPKVIHSLRDSA